MNKSGVRARQDKDATTVRHRGPSWPARTALAAAGVLLALGSFTALEAQDADRPAASEPADDGAPAPAVAAPTDPKPSEYRNWHTLTPGEFQGYNQRATLLQRGRAVYHKYCVGCHGPTGKGDGPAARRLLTKPRDFTSGIYKFRSTDSSSLPLEADLHRTITRGVARVGMPAFPRMPEHDKVAVIEYIKAFYPDWEQEKGERVIVPVPKAPNDLHETERVRRGRVVFLAMGCGLCHGRDGAGTGATRTEYIDDWGFRQKAFDFTRGRLKGGDDPEDIYRTFRAGLRSIMPRYDAATLLSATQENEIPSHLMIEGESKIIAKTLKQFPRDSDAVSALSEAERAALADRHAWDLVSYLISLRRTWTPPKWLHQKTRRGVAPKSPAPRSEPGAGS